MATRARRSAGKAGVRQVNEESEAEADVSGARDAHTDDAGEDQHSALKFTEPLSWRAGKAIPVAELLRRLKDLNTELQALAQDEEHRQDLVARAKDLASHNLLGHKDRGVKAYTACCLVEIFRLCAPNAPFTASQLTDIFSLLVTSILPALADPSSPYNQQHLQVLRSLAEVKSILLLSDVPSASDLMHSLFVSCFDVLSGPSKAESGEELSKHVENYMTTMLVALVDEVQSLPSSVVDVILAQFLRADPRSITVPSSRGKKAVGATDVQETLLRFKEAPPAYNMAKNVCNAIPDKMSRLVLNHFSQVLLQMTTASSFGTKQEDSSHGPSEEQVEESRKAHNMIKELWRSCPTILGDLVPQLEQELGAEDVQLRYIATEAIGDMIAGIGAAGPPSSPALEPSAYPSQSLVAKTQPPFNFLLTPQSPISFIARHAQSYQSFLGRRHDRSAAVRAVWTTAIGRVLMTNAGRVGLDNETEKQLLSHLSRMLMDSDDKVRLNAVRAIELLGYEAIIKKVAALGDTSGDDSFLYTLTHRVKDRNIKVRTEAIQLLAKIWGVGAGALYEEDERVTALIGSLPSRIFDACRVNEPDLEAQIDRALYEILLPVDFPPLKARDVQATNGSSRRQKNGQAQVSQDDVGFTEADIDKLRAERELVLIKGLEPEAKKVLWSKGKPENAAAFLKFFLSKCEEYNGGAAKKNSTQAKNDLGKLIDVYAKRLPEPTRASEDLWKFAKLHDRRCYALMRFCIDPESDYRKIQKSIKELKKRLSGDTGSQSTMVDYIMLILYRCSVLLFNRSHVPAIIDISRNDTKGLGSSAHELLKEMSTKNPEVFKAHIHDLCKSLIDGAPSKSQPNSPGAVLDLRACAGFLKSFPDEAPKERAFAEAMRAYATFGSTAKSAKYAVSILMLLSGKDLHTKFLLSSCMKNFKYGEPHFVTCIAALSELMLSGSRTQVDDAYDDVSELAISQVLLHADENATFVPAASGNDEWSDDVDDGCSAKLWALKLLVNRVRACKDNDDVEQTAAPIFTFLIDLIDKEGALPGGIVTPVALKHRLRLEAARLLLKLCCTSKQLDSMLDPSSFIKLALVAQDSTAQVRRGFVESVEKGLGRNKLAHRFYTILLLLAYEPDGAFRAKAMTFLRARNARFRKEKITLMESMLARLLSLLAHHPDMSTDARSIKGQAQYIIFYLKCVADRENLGLIFHIAQRLKSVRDGIDKSARAPEDITASSEKLYILSELAQTIIATWAESHGWRMQSYSGKTQMPTTLFGLLPNHRVSQEIALRQFMDEDVVDEVPELVRKALRQNKRKHEAAGGASSKRARISEGVTGKVGEKLRPSSKKAKTSKISKKGGKDEMPSSERRRSGRTHAQANYAESSDEEGDGDGGEDEEEVDEESEDEEEQQSEGGQAPVDGDAEEVHDEDDVGDVSAPDASVLPEPEPPSSSTSRGQRSSARNTRHSAVASPVASKRSRLPGHGIADRSVDAGAKGKDAKDTLRRAAGRGPSTRTSGRGTGRARAGGGGGVDAGEDVVMSISSDESE